MKINSFFLFIFFLIFNLNTGLLCAQDLPFANSNDPAAVNEDWILRPLKIKAAIFKSSDGKNIVMTNGLLKREFRISPDLACIDFVNLKTGQQLLRSVREEARLTISGKTYPIGGLYGLKEKAYLRREWIGGLTANRKGFNYVSCQLDSIKQSLKPNQKFWSLDARNASGKMISFLFRSQQPELEGLEVQINYEIYDGIPLLVKSLKLVNRSKNQIHLDSVVNEVLALVEEESAVAGKFESFKKPQGLYIESNYAFNNSMRYLQSDQTTHWKADSSYKSQVNYEYLTPALLEVYPENAPGIDLKPGESYESVRTHELLMDNDDRERRGLAVRKMYQLIAPWTNANPIFMHVVSKQDDDVRSAIDQCAAVGYEALIISFGSHLHMEDTSSTNIQRWKNMADYAHSRNVRIGCYSLFSSRTISPEDDIIDPKTGKVGGALFANAPCFGSRWGLWYRDNIKRFFRLTGFDIWENDGPYPGDICGSTAHPGHQNAEDSQWRQIEIQKELYHWLNARDIYINSPDWYFLDGTNKISLGYRETNFKLPRDQQKVLNRQNIYDGTWEKTPAMSWGFVPLTEYGGGGPAATLEPLAAHQADYEKLMMQYYGAGIQACYRGPRLYDTAETKDMVTKVIGWYKKYRQILNSDIIHLRRADGRDWDGILHVNPGLKEKGLIMLYNPLTTPIKRTIKIPLYYTGLSTSAKIREKEGSSKIYRLNRDFTVDFTFTLPAEGYSWYVVE